MSLTTSLPDFPQDVREGHRVSTMSDVSDEIRLIIQWIVYAVVCQLIDVFGIVTNIINIVCFVKQGFKDPINISLLGLATSDLCCLAPLLWTNICSVPAFSQLDLNFEPMDVQYLTGSWPHLCFSRTTSWITVFITIERCLCITFPLKVKSLITRTRVTVTIICIFVLLTGSVFPVYCVNRLVLRFSPGRNKSVVGLVFTDDRMTVEAINFALNNVCVQLIAFLSLTVCTLILLIKLKSNQKWRQASIAPGQVNSASVRDQKVARMVVVISTLFIICFTPICAIIIGIIVEPEFSQTGRYKNLFIIMGGLGLVLESSNSAMNIFIYYRMSSRYRNVLQNLIGKSK